MIKTKFIIKEKIYNGLGYKCSAGISNNLLLSKLASGYNKPNGQTSNLY
jgi:DNA polymerase eta